MPKVVVLSGRFKRPNQPGHEISFAEHAQVALRDSRGKKLVYSFGVRTDAEAAGWTGLIRRDGFLTCVETQTEEPQMDLTHWYITGFNPNFGFCEQVTDAKDREFLPEGAIVLANAVVKTA